MLYCYTVVRCGVNKCLGYTLVIATLAGDIHALIVQDGKEFFATSVLQWKPKEVKKAYRKRWMIEECITLLKSEFGFETCQARTIPTIRAHAYVCLMSFNTLELFRVKHKRAIPCKTQKSYSV
ncbi:MAG: hypothetical protein EAZ92_05905 [Candidatus Kapaibacterium sp.]|nr:MAG: hypothetical protein EAZ92_05905 [Candidatus Kapabacteria bacterium]